MDIVCQSCGAPARPGVVSCEFCENPVSAEAAKHAIGCPQCKTLNVDTSQQCSKCKSWLVVQCLFCNQLSAYTMPSCRQCNEPFLGAAERKSQRDSQVQRQQWIQTAGAVAPLAGGLLGAVAGAVLGNSFGNGGANVGFGGYGNAPPPRQHHHEPQGEGFLGSVLGSGDEVRSDYGSTSGSGASEGGFLESFANSVESNARESSSDDEEQSRGSSDDD